MKRSYAEDKAESDAAKAPIEGAIIKYRVTYIGGFPKNRRKNLIY